MTNYYWIVSDHSDIVGIEADGLYTTEEAAREAADDGQYIHTIKHIATHQTVVTKKFFEK